MRRYVAPPSRDDRERLANCVERYLIERFRAEADGVAVLRAYGGEPGACRRLRDLERSLPRLAVGSEAMAVEVWNSQRLSQQAVVGRRRARRGRGVMRSFAAFACVVGRVRGLLPRVPAVAGRRGARWSSPSAGRRTAPRRGAWTPRCGCSRRRRSGRRSLLVYVAGNSPRVYRWFVLMSLFAPGVLFFVGSSVAESVLRVFFGRLLDWHFAGKLPAWPLKKTDKKPSLVIGEVHHRTELCEVPRPWWLRMPEKGLFTGLIIFGAIGTGKTTSCMRPFCRQLLEWQGDDPEKRVAALVLEVKGDFCYDVQEMLQQYGRMDDYMELSLPPEPGDDDYGKRDVWQWNPLFCPWVDTYSLAYSLGAIVNQLFGKSKEPFWQQAYTNVLQWIVAGYRLLPGGWFTFRRPLCLHAEPEDAAGPWSIGWACTCTRSTSTRSTSTPTCRPRSSSGCRVSRLLPPT